MEIWHNLRTNFKRSKIPGKIRRLSSVHCHNLTEFQHLSSRCSFGAWDNVMQSKGGEREDNVWTGSVWKREREKSRKGCEWRAVPPPPLMISARLRGRLVSESNQLLNVNLCWVPTVSHQAGSTVLMMEKDRRRIFPGILLLLKLVLKLCHICMGS